ncbi:MAG: response regulator [Acidobacteriota bacterium]
MTPSNSENKLSVLVVDDDDPLRSLLNEFLQGKGMDVRCCRDGEEAVSILKESRQPFDVVISDLLMPNVGGMEVLVAAREHHQETQVVIVTGFASLESAINSIHHGAFDYLTKPFKLVELDLILNKIAERKRLIAENHRLTQRIEALYTRLDLLKDNRSKLDRFIAETSERLDEHSQKLDECLQLIQKVCDQSLLFQTSSRTPS